MCGPSMFPVDGRCTVRDVIRVDRSVKEEGEEEKEGRSNIKQPYLPLYFGAARINVICHANSLIYFL